MRSDLPPGLQLAQSVHAMAEFQTRYPSTVTNWVKNSNYLVVVGVPDEEALLDLAARANWEAQIETHLVREPDLGDEATALALQPGSEAQKLCASMPLALRFAVDYDVKASA